jgi:hypothetical protein
MQFVSKTDSLVTYRLSTKIGDMDSSTKLIWWNTDLSANWFAAMQTHQWTDLLEYKFVSKTDDTDSSTKLICQNTDSSVNWFAATQLVNKLVRYNINSSSNWFAKTQNHKRTDSLGHHNLAAKTVPLETTQFDSATDSLQTTQFDSEN